VCSGPGYEGDTVMEKDSVSEADPHEHGHGPLGLDGTGPRMLADIKPPFIPEGASAC